MSAVKQIKMTKFVSTIMFAFLIFGIMISLTLNMQNVYAESDSNKVVWNLFYLKDDVCHETDFEELLAYADLARKYFELYQLDNVSFEPNCYTSSDFDISEHNTDLDLTIIIFDEVLGEQYLQTHELDGLYSHVGDDRLQNHTVIVCDCSKNKASFEAALTPWILSHELSHFVLSYKGYSQSVIQEAIHSIENEYENCVAQFTIDEDCDDLRITLRADFTTRNFVVMAPYGPAIGNTMVQYTPNGIDSSSLELHRELTNMWISEEIDNSAYLSTLKHFVDPPVIEDLNEFLPELKIENGFVIPELVKFVETDWNDHLNSEDSKADFAQLLRFIPNQKNSPQEIQSEEFPNWFKARALLWSEKRISDKVFFDGIDHLVRMGTIPIN